MNTKTVAPGAFGGLPGELCQYDTAAVAVLPIPYDGTSTWMKGAHMGPAALLEASANMELYDIETDSSPCEHGIVTMPPVICPDDPELMVRQVYERARPIVADGKFLVGIGGEHSITVGLVRALAGRYDDLSVLQFDAHSDTRDKYEGSSYNHACVMARVGDLCPYAQVGIRSMDSSELGRLDRQRTFFAHNVMAGGVDIVDQMMKALTRHVFITIDLDVLDPSVMPSTGTPEPGGLDWYKLIRLIEAVVKEKVVVGFDVTELLPNPSNRAPDFLAAKLIYRLLAMIFAKDCGRIK